VVACTSARPRRRLRRRHADEVNAVAVARKARRPPGKSRAAADATHARLLDEIDRLADDEWPSTTPEAAEFGGAIAGVRSGTFSPT